jgi:predicted carbohydrate-binding protein with CBM48
MTEPDDRMDDSLREEYLRPLAGEAAARERVLARLRLEPAPRESARGWWLDPGVLRVSPLLATAAVIVALAIGAWGGARWTVARRDRAAAIAIHAAPMKAATQVSPAAAGPTTVTFAFRAPGATRVCLVGDFNGWDPDATPLRRAATGEVWTVDLPLPRGLHAYAFIVDGADWSVDPSAPLAPETTFGRRNALLVVGEGGAL